MLLSLLLSLFTSLLTIKKNLQAYQEVSTKGPPGMANCAVFTLRPLLSGINLPPNSEEIGYATEGALFISAQLSETSSFRPDKSSLSRPEMSSSSRPQTSSSSRPKTSSSSRPKTSSSSRPEISSSQVPRQPCAVSGTFSQN